MIKFYLIIIIIIILSSNVSATTPEADWGIAAGLRSAVIPYKAKDDTVEDFIPLIFYEDETFFIRGLTAGAKLYTQDKWQFSLIGRYRYFDIPSDYQNHVQGNELDVGFQAKYQMTDNLETNVEVMTDDESRFYTALNVRYDHETGPWEYLPYATLRYKSDDFNDRYFGLDGFTDPSDTSAKFKNKIGSGLDLTLGSEVRYHVASNFYLLGRAQLTALDDDTANSVTIDNDVFGEVFLGVAFFNDKSKSRKSSLNIKPYLRVSHGWATPSNMGEILEFDVEDDDQDNQLTSIFYGHPLADEVFGIEPLDIYLTLGYIYHHGSNTYTQTLEPGKGVNTNKPGDYKNNSCDGVNPCTLKYDRQPTNEYVLAIKAFYNFNWPIDWRFGFAEGISYIETVSNIEKREMDRKGYRSSKLMNYLDLTADFSLGDAFDINDLDDVYLGVGIHHRSSIFEESSAYGRIKGGSNYNTVYLQYHF